MRDGAMVRLSFVLAILLLACTALPAWAGDATADGLYEITLSFYSDGELAAQSVYQCGAHQSLCGKLVCGTETDKRLKSWTYFRFGQDVQMDKQVADDLVKLGKNIQQVSFHGIDVLLYSTNADWVEIELRNCRQRNLDNYGAVMHMSEELDQDILNRLLTPAGRIGFAAKRFQPMSWPTAEPAGQLTADQT
jgi:hypothetical protein